MFVNILTSSLAGKTNTICRNSRLLKTVEEEMKILKKKKKLTEDAEVDGPGLEQGKRRSEKGVM